MSGDEAGADSATQARLRPCAPVHSAEDHPPGLEAAAHCLCADRDHRAVASAAGDPARAAWVLSDLSLADSIVAWTWSRASTIRGKCETQMEVGSGLLGKHVFKQLQLTAYRVPSLRSCARSEARSLETRDYRGHHFGVSSPVQFQRIAACPELGGLLFEAPATPMTSSGCAPPEVAHAR